MKAHALLIALSCLVDWPSATLAQSGFQNLDFESAIPPLLPNDPEGYGRVPASQALPGWTASIGTNVETLVFHNDIALSGAGVGLFGPGSGFNPRIKGDYTAMLECGQDLFNGQGTVSASLAQIGTIPGDSQSIWIKIQAGDSPFSVLFGGQPLSLIPVEVQTSYTLFTADVGLFAGQPGELRLRSDLWFGPAGYGKMCFDSIEFSPHPVPETSSVALYLLGASGVGLAFRRRRTGK